jgi:hypothetical protein
MTPTPDRARLEQALTDDQRRAIDQLRAYAFDSMQPPVLRESLRRAVEAVDALLAAQPQPSPEPCRVCRGNGVVPDPSHHSNDPMEYVACPSCRPSPEPLQLVCGRTDPDDRVEALIRQVRANSPRSGPDDNSACGQPIELRWAFRCVECGRWFHRGCIEKHFAAHRQPSPEPKRKGWCNVCGFVGNDQAFVAHDCAEVSRLKNAGVPRAQE